MPRRAKTALVRHCVQQQAKREESRNRGHPPQNKFTPKKVDDGREIFKLFFEAF